MTLDHPGENALRTQGPVRSPGCQPQSRAMWARASSASLHPGRPVPRDLKTATHEDSTTGAARCAGPDPHRRGETRRDVCPCGARVMCVLVCVRARATAKGLGTACSDSASGLRRRRVQAPARTRARASRGGCKHGPTPPTGTREPPPRPADGRPSGATPGPNAARPPAAQRLCSDRRTPTRFPGGSGRAGPGRGARRPERTGPRRPRRAAHVYFPGRGAPRPTGAPRYSCRCLCLGLVLQ